VSAARRLNLLLTWEWDKGYEELPILPNIAEIAELGKHLFRNFGNTGDFGNL
jgi:hypothetical protein